MNYERTFGSKFPSEPISAGYHLDVDDSVMSLINQYYEYMSTGHTSSAYDLYEKNKAKLNKYMIDMNYINYLEEEVYNTGVAALLKQNTVISSSEPTDGQIENSYWLKEY